MKQRVCIWWEDVRKSLPGYVYTCLVFRSTKSLSEMRPGNLLSLYWQNIKIIFIPLFSPPTSSYPYSAETKHFVVEIFRNMLKIWKRRIEDIQIKFIDCKIIGPMPTIKDDIYNFLLLSVAVCLAQRKNMFAWKLQKYFIYL